MKDLQLYSVNDMQTMADAIAKSGLFGMKNADQALALMLVAQAEGMHPATVTQDYDIIQGRACRKSHSLLSRFQQMGGRVTWHTLDKALADATFSHPSGGELRVQWTIEQAKTAGLAGKDNWKKYPQAMLRARCITEGIRAVYPAAIGGMLVAEEAQDMSRQEIDMGPADVVPEAATQADKIKAKLAPKFEETATVDMDTGELLPPPTFDETMAALGNCKSPEMLHDLISQSRAIYLDLSDKQKSLMTDAIDALREEYGNAPADA